MTASRHKRDTNARTTASKAALLSAPFAVLATLGAVTVGVVQGMPGEASYTSANGAALSAELADRGEEVSRDASRGDSLSPAEVAAQKERAATAKAVAGAKRKLWATTDLNLWTLSSDDAKRAGELEAGTKVLVTGRERNDRTEVVIKGGSRWVTSGYLSAEKPIAAAAGLSMAPCPDGSVENGLTSAAVYVYRSVCHAFPQITSYGGWDNHGEHTSGRALDIMTSDPQLGDAIADFLRAHAAELNLYDILWSQRIWTPVRSSEGWRYVSDRGSATANHYDHVHVSVY